MLDGQRSEKMGMLGLHKAAVVIVSLLLIYDYCSITTPNVRVKDPVFSLLGPYNTTVTNIIEDNYSQLIDLKNFTFKINTLACRDAETGLLLLIIVSSNPNNFENRKVIRNTWGKAIDSTKIVFFVGESMYPNVTRLIVNESDTYGDLVQGNFVDAYRNMTYKHVMGLKWVTHHCSGARYVLKTDDDIFVNSHGLRHFLARELSPWGARGLIACQVLKNARVQRSFRSKWRVSPTEYAHRYYPTYCAGYAVLYSQDVVQQLLTAAQKAPYFWIDDVHLTGVLAEQLGIGRTPFDSLILSFKRAKILELCGPAYVGPFLLGPPDLSVVRITQLWKAMLE